jgi:hypothetical protein
MRTGLVSSLFTVQTRTYLVQRQDPGSHRDMQHWRFKKNFKNDLANSAGMIIFQQSLFELPAEKKFLDQFKAKEGKMYNR